VHEAYLRLVGAGRDQHWESRGHFFAAAAEAMRRILIENARRKAGPKAGGGMQRHDISVVDPETEQPPVDLLELDEALERLDAKDPRKVIRVGATHQRDDCKSELVPPINVMIANGGWHQSRVPMIANGGWHQSRYCKWWVAPIPLLQSRCYHSR
jgi:hypothetical protein